ncbi:MAG: Fic family protein [Nitrospirota bacterium]
MRLIREIHEKLLQRVRGGNRTPGEFRTKQNWIGPENTPITNATFVPPPVGEMHKALGNLEEFLHDTKSYPPLIHCALAHAQFETIHPFLDGNGRIGRLLITFLLCQRGVLARPLLYLSHFLKAHRAEYYDRLMAIRNDGNWNQWLKFFLSGVHGVSRIATTTARKILPLGKEDRALIEREMRGTTDSIKALDYLFESPLLTVRILEQHLHCSYVKANNLIAEFQRLGILEETSGGDRKRNRRFRYKRYLKIFDATESATAETEERRPVETTVAE